MPDLLRHKDMRTSRNAAVLLLLSFAAAACGTPGAPTDGGRDRDVPGYRGCTAGDLAGAGRSLPRPDLDGDGRADRLVLTGPDAACPDSLVAVLGGRVVGTSVAGMDLLARGAQVVRPHGGDELVLLRSRTGADARWQPRLFAAGRDGGLTEVTLDGRPLLPQVDTQRGSAPMDVTCTADGGVAVLTSKAHHPPGIVLAWDVRRTTYDIEGGVASVGGTTMVREAAADPLLRGQSPELYDGRLFADCG